jgi:hypothetical protein
MLDEATMRTVAKHSMLHDMGMGLCTCPCYDALMTVAAVVKRENDLRLTLARTSPEALAALSIATADDEERANDD